MRMLNINRAYLLMKFPKARLHRLEDGRAQIITPVGGGQFKALGPVVGQSHDAREAWLAAYMQQGFDI